MTNNSILFSECHVEGVQAIPSSASPPLLKQRHTTAAGFDQSSAVLPPLKCKMALSSTADNSGTCLESHSTPCLYRDWECHRNALAHSHPAAGQQTASLGAVARSAVARGLLTTAHLALTHSWQKAGPGKVTRHVA